MLREKRPAEETFILELIKTTFERGDTSILKTALDECRVDTLNDLVRWQGLSAFFYDCFVKKDIHFEIPQDLHQSWKKAAGIIALRNTMIENEGQVLLTFLHQSKVDYCLLKGFAYVEEIYGSRKIRPIADLDILINREDYPLVKEYLLDHGYRFIIMPEFGKYPEDKWIEIQEKINNEMHLGKDIGVITIYVDIHWGTANLKTDDSPLEKMFKLSIDHWLQHQTTFFLGETEVKCLKPTLHFIHAVFHFAYGHQFAGAKWYLDICRFLFFMDDRIDWALVNKIVDRPGCRRLFAITRRLVSEMIGENHQAIKDWASIDNCTVNNFDYRFFKNRLFDQRTISGKYLSYMMMPEGFFNKWKVLTYILFDREVFKLWEATGQKINPLAQPFYVFYWGLSEITAGRRKKR